MEHAAKQWEARQSKVANNKHWRKWLERQNNVNYRNEYDRLRGELFQYRIPYGSIPKLKKRVEELSKPDVAEVQHTRNYCREATPER